LNGTFTDPSEDVGGNWTGEIVTLGLNLGFDSCSQSHYSNGCKRLKDLYVCDFGQPYFQEWGRCSKYYGHQISEIYSLAKSSLGGCCHSSSGLCDMESLFHCIHAINNAFTGGKNIVTTYPHNEFSAAKCKSNPNS